MFYLYTFEDGYVVCVKSGSRNELILLSHAARRHGRIVSKVPA